MTSGADPAGASASTALDGREGDAGAASDGALPAWLPLVVLGVLFVALFWPFLRARAIFYDEQPRYSHCLLLPAVSALWIWEGWDRLSKLARRPSKLGLALVGGSVIVYVFGRVTSINAAQHAAFLGTVMGLVWGVLGWR